MFSQSARYPLNDSVTRWRDQYTTHTDTSLSLTRSIATGSSIECRILLCTHSAKSTNQTSALICVIDWPVWSVSKKLHTVHERAQAVLSPFKHITVTQTHCHCISFQTPWNFIERRFYSTNQYQPEAEGDPGRDRVNIWSRNRLDCLQREVQKNREIGNYTCYFLWRWNLTKIRERASDNRAPKRIFEPMGKEGTWDYRQLND
jgi:hypothetical protein